MNLVCWFKGHNIGILYEKEFEKLWVDTAGCIRCFKVWRWEIEK